MAQFSSLSLLRSMVQIPFGMPSMKQDPDPWSPPRLPDHAEKRLFGYVDHDPTVSARLIKRPYLRDFDLEFKSKRAWSLGIQTRVDETCRPSPRACAGRPMSSGWLALMPLRRCLMRSSSWQRRG